MYTILFIDDNKSMTKLFECLGAEYKFSAFTASSIDEGIEIALKHKPDVILTDINMPDGDGFTLTSRFKSHKILKEIPIIGCSVTFSDKGSKFTLLGGSKFVNDKPSTIDKLNHILDGILPRLSAGI